MMDVDPSLGSAAFPPPDPCYFFRFGLIVTGEGERQHLPKLFKALTASSICNFEVIRHIGQRSPIISNDRRIRMVGRGEIIPTKDEEEIGLPARRYLDADSCRFVVLVDDLEYDRLEQAQLVFDRYRLAFDTILRPNQRPRASVHFLVYMLEAYYFADSQAVNAVLEIQPPLTDYSEDVEDIRHPKNKLLIVHPTFREVDDGGRILDRMDVQHVLSRPDACAGLRTLFAWCIRVLERHPDYLILNLGLDATYHLHDGVLSDLTRSQLDSL